MKLVFGATTIFDDSVGVYASGLVSNGQMLSQEQHFLRAANAAFEDRGNKYLEIPFVVTREWGSLREAQEHFLDHALAVMGKADAVFTLGSGVDTSVRTGAGSILQASGSHKGVSTTFNYTLRVPKLVAGVVTTWDDLVGQTWAEQTENWDTI